MKQRNWILRWLFVFYLAGVLQVEATPTLPMIEQPVHSQPIPRQPALRFASGVIFYDSNINGFWDEGEVELDGVQVVLWRDENGNSLLDAEIDTRLDEMISGDDPATVETEVGWFGFPLDFFIGYMVQIAPENFEVNHPLHLYCHVSWTTYGYEPRALDWRTITFDFVHFGYVLDVGPAPCQPDIQLFLPLINPVP